MARRCRTLFQQRHNHPLKAILLFSKFFPSQSPCEDCEGRSLAIPHMYVCQCFGAWGKSAAAWLLRERTFSSRFSFRWHLLVQSFATVSQNLRHACTNSVLHFVKFWWTPISSFPGWHLFVKRLFCLVCQSLEMEFSPTEFSICYETCFCFLITDCHLWIQVTFEFECGNIMCFCAEILPKNCNFLQFFDDITQSTTIRPFHSSTPLLKKWYFLFLFNSRARKHFH